VLKLEEGSNLTTSDAELLRTVIDQLAPVEEAEPAEKVDEGDKAMLELMKAKLKLMGGN